MEQCELCELSGQANCDTCNLVEHGEDTNMYRSEFLFNQVNYLIDDNEVFPICVPSYNRPNSLLLRYAEKLPMVLFIRREQEELYSQYKGKCKIVLLDDVFDIGTTRAAIVNWAIENDIDNIFMMDDDITNGDFMVPGKSSVSNKEFMKAYRTLNDIPESVELWFFKMWQYLIRQCSDKLTLSSPGTRGDNWSIDHMNKPVSYNSGACISCIHLNIRNLRDNNINYGSNQVEGAEDYALQYKIMSEGLYCCVFKDLLFRVPGVGAGKGGNTAERTQLEQRYHRFINCFMNNVLDSWNADKVSTKVSRGGIPSVRFVWTRWKIKGENMMYSVQSILEDLYSLKEE